MGVIEKNAHGITRVLEAPMFILNSKRDRLTKLRRWLSAFSSQGSRAQGVALLLTLLDEDRKG